MSADPNKKSPRTFQCRDVLWETFEQMARELECSVDYLINEAMKQYARQRSYGASPSGRGMGRGSDAPPASMPSPYGGRISAPTPPPPPRGGGLPPPRGGSLPAPPPPPPRGGMGSLGISSRGPGSLGVPPPPPGRSVPPGPRSAPPPLPGRGVGGGYGGAASSSSSGLTVIYNGERLNVTKDRFVIGRGKQSSDLTLKDPNVSRQHAMVEYQNGVYFMVDMGSTNGVEYNGQRIARKQIAEGDVFRICDHDLRFTYR